MALNMFTINAQLNQFWHTSFETCINKNSIKYYLLFPNNALFEWDILKNFKISFLFINII